MMPPAILDTTLLSNFAHVQRPRLLQMVFGEDVATTSAVMAELETGEELGRVPRCDWDWLPVLTLTEEERALAVELERIVDVGEAESLAVAQMRQLTFLSDDLAARRLAGARGVVVSGTIGVLLRLLEAQHLSLQEADHLLSVMVEHGYRSPVASLRELVP